MLKVAPLSASLMMFSMIGIIIVSIFGFWPDDTDISGLSASQLQAYEKGIKFKRDIAIASDLVLALMFLSSIISSTYAPIEDEIEMEKRSKLDTIIK